MTDISMVWTTAANLTVARELVARLVEERRIACGNVVPNVTSVFRWDGDVQTEAEVLVLMKTRKSMVDDLTARLAELHPYDVPEILAVPVEAGLDAYCRWVARETGEQAE